jgi:3-dehydroquinate synthase
MKKIDIELAGKYSIYIADGLLQQSMVVDFCKELASRVVIIADDNVIDLYGKDLLDKFQQQNVKAYLLEFVGGEKNKTREEKAKLENQLFEMGCNRDTCLLALGGGITTDIVGFVAATFCRGIPVVYVPTTLLAMVDASIGGKTGVNTPYGKNLIGAFYQPKAVFVDSEVLQTLTPEEFNNGLVEVIKHALIGSYDDFVFLEKNVAAISNKNEKIISGLIAANCIVKKNIVEQDELDYDIRQLLNFGHTIGHALEKVSNHKLSHGQAVALGVIAESYMSYKLGFLSEASFARIKEIFNSFNISLQCDAKYSKEKIKQALLLDKKAVGGEARFVLLDEIGKPHIALSGYTMAVADEIVSAGIDCLFAF